MLGPSHHKLHMRAADIDHESLLHRTPELPRAGLLAEADCLTELLENTFMFLSA
jgi:hypothetical protein